jgi:hypothetical protein
MDAVRLDATGGICTKALESELQSALQFDIEYRQKDNMKKRAIKLAPSYDEFKARVACAGLKKVTSEEVESLSKPKKGWIKGSQLKDTVGSASILEDEQRSMAARSSSTAEAALQIKSSSARAPKTTLELSRDLRRCASTADKVRFLATLGLKKTKVILKKDIDADFLEELVTISTSDEAAAHEKAHEEAVALAAVAAAAACREDGDGDGGVAEEAAEVGVKKFDRVRWLKALSAINSFSLLIKFAKEDVVQAAKAVLSASEKEEAPDVLAKFS